MGCVSSSGDPEQRNLSKQIDKEISNSSKNPEKKILLLGTGESGKSTIVKQLRLLYGTPFTQEELLDYRSQMYLNMEKAIRDLIEILSFEDGHEEEEEINTLIEFIKSFSNEEISLKNHKLVDAVIRITDLNWIIEAFEKHSSHDFSDSTPYFLKNLKRISEPEYIPNDEDVIRARVKTTGISEIKIKFKDLEIKLCDVGGQRSERKKWISCFENVTATLFVASLIEYDKVLVEDQETNRMKESLKLFESISNNQYLNTIPMIVFLNKKDLLEHKIAYSPITTYFSDYTGPQTFKDSVNFIRAKYIEAGTKSSQKNIYVQEVCATDRKSISYVFDACVDILVQSSLTQLGFV